MNPRTASGDERPSIHVPTAVQDQPPWTRIAALAAVGFVIGIAWPRMAGVRLGPAVPESTAPAASASPVASSAPSVTPSATGTPSAAPREATASVTVAVGRGSVVGCRTASGDSLKAAECGGLAGFDALVTPRLRKLAECPAAATTAGKLRLAVVADFARSALSVELARGGRPASADSLLGCARASLAGTTLSGVSHEHPRYTVIYPVTFGGESAAGASGVAVAEPASAEPRPAAIDTPLARASSATDGTDSTPTSTGHGGTAESATTAQVQWEVALVRDAPKTGKVIARLPRGTTIHLGVARDGWFPVRFGDGDASEGWVYRGAVGR